LPTIAGTSNDARHAGAPAEAARRATACHCCGRRTGGSPEATRRAFNKRFLTDLARDWEQHGPEVFKRVRPESPAAYLKVCAMLVPREMQIEHSGGVKAMSDEALENAIEALERMLGAKVIEGVAGRWRRDGLHRVKQGARCEGATEPTVGLRLRLWERTARTESLEQSTSAPRILSADAADAIEALVGPPERRSLPVAFDKNAI